jgi:hypothetical protein
VFRYLFESQELSSKEAVKLTRRVGELVYMPRIHAPRPSRSLMIAMLLADGQESYVIPLLNHACMLEVRGGFFIEGTEIDPVDGHSRTSRRTPTLNAGSAGRLRGLRRSTPRAPASRRAPLGK